MQRDDLPLLIVARGVGASGEIVITGGEGVPAKGDAESTSRKIDKVGY